MFPANPDNTSPAKVLPEEVQELHTRLERVQAWREGAEIDLQWSFSGEEKELEERKEKARRKKLIKKEKDRDMKGIREAFKNRFIPQRNERLGARKMPEEVGDVQ